MLKLKSKRIKTTRSDNGVTNGYVVPIWNSTDKDGGEDLRPDQVYVTAVAPYSKKGPHLHMRRRGVFVCLVGEVVIATRQVAKVTIPESDKFGLVIQPGSRVTLHVSSADREQYQRVVVPSGVVACIYNTEGKEAVVLNLPSPAWTKDTLDEWVVDGWEDPPHGKLLAALDGQMGGTGDDGEEED